VPADPRRDAARRGGIRLCGRARRSVAPAGRAALRPKITLPRDVVSGDVGDRDVYGAQQHAPLLDIEL